MPATHLVACGPLTPESFAPFGEVLRAEPHEAAIAVRDGEDWVFNVLSYEHKPLVCDHLNAHHRATQTLLRWAASPLCSSSPRPGSAFASRADLARCARSCSTGRRRSASATAHGTGARTRSVDHVDLLNLQGRGFATDNEIAHLERDLDMVVVAQLYSDREGGRGRVRR